MHHIRTAGLSRCISWQRHCDGIKPIQLPPTHALAQAKPLRTRLSALPPRWSATMDDRTQHIIDVESDDMVTDFSDEDASAFVKSTVFERWEQYGRLYNPHKGVSYHRPVDEAELERLDIAAAMFMMINDNHLHLAPLDGKPGRVLDVGAGTGLWCIDMGDAYPSAEILGVDISPCMPRTVPPNVQFEIDDVEEEWTYSRPFDYIHCAYMNAAITDWQKLVDQCYTNLKPGGWIEMADYDYHYYSQDGSLTEDHAISRWEKLVTQASDTRNRTIRAGTMLEDWVRNAGFENVSTRRYPIPIGPWPRDKKLKKIGIFNWAQTTEAVPTVSLMLIRGILGWSQAELELFMMEVRADFKDPKIHMMFDLYTVWAQKPREPPEQSTNQAATS